MHKNKSYQSTFVDAVEGELIKYRNTWVSMSRVSPVFHTVVTVKIIQPWWLSGLGRRQIQVDGHKNEPTVDRIPLKRFYELIYL